MATRVLAIDYGPVKIANISQYAVKRDTDSHDG